jgi:hypothetical protein
MSAPAIYRIVDISYKNPTLVASAFVGSRYMHHAATVSKAKGNANTGTWLAPTKLQYMHDAKT